jgi:hypothetical protein
MMKIQMQPNPRDYEIRIWYSAEKGDECFVAQVVEWPGIMAHGYTPRKLRVKFSWLSKAPWKSRPNAASTGPRPRWRVRPDSDVRQLSALNSQLLPATTRQLLYRANEMSSVVKD